MSESYYQENNMLKEVKICYLIISFIKLSDVKIQLQNQGKWEGMSAVRPVEMVTWNVIVY